MRPGRWPVVTPAGLIAASPSMRSLTALPAVPQIMPPAVNAVPPVMSPLAVTWSRPPPAQLAVPRVYSPLRRTCFGPIHQFFSNADLHSARDSDTSCCVDAGADVRSTSAPPAHANGMSFAIGWLNRSADRHDGHGQSDEPSSDRSTDELHNLVSHRAAERSQLSTSSPSAAWQWPRNTRDISPGTLAELSTALSSPIRRSNEAEPIWSSEIPSPLKKFRFASPSQAHSPTSSIDWNHIVLTAARRSRRHNSRRRNRFLRRGSTSSCSELKGHQADDSMHALRKWHSHTRNRWWSTPVLSSWLPTPRPALRPKPTRRGHSAASTSCRIAGSARHSARSAPPNRGCYVAVLEMPCSSRGCPIDRSDSRQLEPFYLDASAPYEHVVVPPRSPAAHGMAVDADCIRSGGESPGQEYWDSLRYAAWRDAGLSAESASCLSLTPPSDSGDESAKQQRPACWKDPSLRLRVNGPVSLEMVGTSIWHELAKHQPAVVRVAGRGGSPTPLPHLPEPPPQVLSVSEMLPAPKEDQEPDQMYWDLEVVSNLRAEAPEQEQPPKPFWE